MGLVASLSRPGGNLTGTTIMAVEMGPKRLDFIRQLVPNTSVIAMLINPNFPTALAEARGVQDAARTLGIEINVLNASTRLKSTRLSQISSSRKLALWWSERTRFCLDNVINSRGWQHAMPFPRCFSYVSSSKLAAY